MLKAITPLWRHLKSYPPGDNVHMIHKKAPFVINNKHTTLIYRYIEKILSVYLYNVKLRLLFRVKEWKIDVEKEN